MTRGLILAAVAALALSGCGGDEDSGGSDDSGADVTSGTPTCSDVWVAGQTLPEDYDGCERDDGNLEAAVVQECTDGSEFTGFDDRYWAVLGGEIKDAGAPDATTDDPEYQADYEACSQTE
jgi:hypothetical protein